MRTRVTRIQIHVSVFNSRFRSTKFHLETLAHPCTHAHRRPHVPAWVWTTPLACGVRYNSEELVQEFEKSVRQDGRVNLQLEGELDWFLLVRYTYDKIIDASKSWFSIAWKMWMLARCRKIQDPTLTRFPSLTRLIKSLCMLMQHWFSSFSTLLSTPYFSSDTPWAVLLGTCPRRHWHVSPILRWCCVILLASRKDSSRDVANECLCFISEAKFWSLSIPAGQTTRTIGALPWLAICSSTMRPFHGVRLLF